MSAQERDVFRACIRAMDAEWRNQSSGEQDTISEHPLTPGRFKAMFGGQRKDSQ